VGAFTACVHLLGASLTGAIIDETGKPVVGATVSAVRQAAFIPPVNGRPQFAPGEVQFGASWTTDTSGSFQAASIPAGRYLICVDMPNSPLLDPCVWAASIQVNNLGVAEQRGPGSITVPLGTLVLIAVSDRLALLPAWTEISSDGGIIVGISHDNGIWTPATRNLDKTLSVAVPTGRAYQLWVFSWQYTYTLTGIGSTTTTVAPGTAIPNGLGTLSASIAAGSEPAGEYQISITGKQN
jgi:hypothetical protein